MYEAASAEPLLTVAHAHLQAQVTSSAAACESSRARAAELEATVEASSGAAGAAESAVAELERRLHDAEAGLASSEAECDELRQQCSALSEASGSASAQVLYHGHLSSCAQLCHGECPLTICLRSELRMHRVRAVVIAAYSDQLALLSRGAVRKNEQHYEVLLSPKLKSIDFRMLSF